MTLKKRKKLETITSYVFTWLNLVALLFLTISVAAKPDVSKNKTLLPAQPSLLQQNVLDKLDKGNSDNLVQFCNNTLIDWGAVTQGPAVLYPSTITVPGGTGTIGDISITLNDVTHSWASDIEILLVGPTGANLVPMNGVGGSSGFDTTATVTISDSGASVFPGGVIASGTYQPTSFGGTAGFPAPAPVGPYNTPPTGGAASFASVYGGTLSDGDWDLYVFDSAFGDTGSIANGWCIDITPAGGPGTLSLDSGSYETDEAGVNATITVNRTGGTLGAVSVMYATSAGTATGGAACLPNVDYVDAGSTLNWADGDGAPKTFMVPLCEDTLSESPAETVNLALTTPTGGATLGTSAATLSITDVASQYRNPTGFPVPDNGQTSSSLTVAGATLTPGRVRVTLYDVSHTFPDDLDVLLVAPDGSTFVILGDSGGGTDIVNQTLTFEDAATTIAPSGATLSTGSYEPANWVTPVTDFDPPAPPGPYTEPGNSLSSLGGPMLNTTFNGNPNGTWNLYVRDDAGVDTGAVNGGFGLEFVAPTAAAATIAGRVLSSSGRGLSNVYVRLSGGAFTQPIFARTNHFGYYVFDELPVGDTYILEVSSKRYTFQNPTRVVTLDEDLTNIDFNGNEGF